MDNFVYVLKEYPFYECSENYEKVKDHFNKIVDKTGNGYGYVIRKYKLDEVYSLGNVRVGVDSEYCDKVCFDGELVECSVYPLSNKKVFKGVNHHTFEEVTVIVKGRTRCYRLSDEAIE